MKLKREQIRELRIVIGCMYGACAAGLIAVIELASHPAGSMCQYTRAVYLDTVRSWHDTEPLTYTAACVQPTPSIFLQNVIWALIIILLIVCVYRLGLREQNKVKNSE